MRLVLYNYAKKIQNVKTITIQQILNSKTLNSLKNIVRVITSLQLKILKLLVI